MTSNLGAKDSERAMIGFGPSQRTGEDEKAMKDFFKPEFRNRIDAVVKFNKLAPSTMTSIVHKFTQPLIAQLQETHEVKLLITDAMVNHLAVVGFDAQMGARPLSRQVDMLLRTPISKKVLFEQLKGVTLVADYDGEKVTIKVDSAVKLIEQSMSF
jgi:ATP-dependent Clp protease ATP-binding subunit ClpA